MKILGAFFAILLVIFIVGALIDNQKTKAINALQKKCEAAKADNESQRKELENQYNLFKNKQEIESKAVKSKIDALQPLIQSLTYEDSAARVGVSAQLSDLQDKLTKLETDSNAFYAKYKSKWDDGSKTSKSLYDCTTHSKFELDAADKEKYEDAVNAAKQKIEIYP